MTFCFLDLIISMGFLRVIRLVNFSYQIVGHSECLVSLFGLLID